ncbi:XF1762 family protein [Escherichia coli]
MDDGLTLEVNRTCPTGERNANSALYGAVWRGKSYGLSTFIYVHQADESGASLRAAGFVRVKEFLQEKLGGIKRRPAE